MSMRLGDVRDDVQVLVERHEAGEDLDDVGRRTGVGGAGGVQRDRVAAEKPQLAFDAIRQVRRGLAVPAPWSILTRLAVAAASARDEDKREPARG